MGIQSDVSLLSVKNVKYYGRASLYYGRAEKCVEGSAEQKKYIDLALADIDAILQSDS